MSQFGGALALGDGEALFGGEQLLLAEAARRANPEAVAARAASATAYEGLNAAAAQRLAGEAFPGLIDARDGGPPPLPAGERIVGFPSDFAARLALPGGKHGVLDSVAPIATSTPSGRAAIDLTPRAVGSGFEAVRSPAGIRVRIGSSLSEGASLVDLGVSLTPVTVGGAALRTGGRVDGASVFYAGSEDARAVVLDMDTLTKLDTYGFSTETILRSQRSPQRLFFRVGLPRGASLVQAGKGSGSVRVVAGGRTIAQIGAPAGHDAEGAVVPLSLAVSGDALALTVRHRAGEFRFPIEVDPTVEDTALLMNAPLRNWVWTRTGEAFQSETVGVNGNVEGLGEHSYYYFFERKPYTAGQYALFEYPTQKESRIYAFHALTASGYTGFGNISNLEGTGLVGRIYIENNGVVENLGGKPIYLPASGEANNTLCVVTSCGVPSVGSGANGAFMELYAEANGEGESGIKLKSSSAVDIVQEKGPTASLDTTDATLAGRTNASYGGWLNASAWSSAVIGVKAFDPGIGVNKEGISSPNKAGWGVAVKNMEQNECAGAQCNECYENECPTTKAHGKPLVFFTTLTGGELPEGEDTVEAKVEDAVGLNATATGKVRIDNAAPHELMLTGLPVGNVIGGTAYSLSANATDGAGSTLSSGISSFALSVDGRELTRTKLTSCTPGPCTGSGEWSIDGRALAAGQHELKLTATDGAGNVAQQSYTLFVRHASPVAVGPGSVDPQSGDFNLTSGDVSMGGGLTVGRSYDSRRLLAGAGGPLGPQWAFSMGGQESLEKLPYGSMVLTDASGGQAIFMTDGNGGFVSPPGDANLTLSKTPCEAGQTEYMLKNAAAATTTCFKAPAGGTGEVFVPSIAQGPVATDTVTYVYETAEVSGKKLIRASEALAPVPAGVSCSPTLKAGCRALTFNYATSTTATGESASEWGDYLGNLTRVYFTAYDPVSKAMKTVEVAHYLYDKQGRLRAEWDPRVSPALKTTYGYDSEGHVTALDPPSQQPWLFVYGATVSDPSPGRLVSVTRPGASTALGSGVAPQNTGAPSLSSTEPVVGTTLSANPGAWSNSPLAYAYQWERCNSVGGECASIAGANNQTYKPGPGDESHTLVVEVRALNGAGAAAASSAASGVVKLPATPYYASQFGVEGTGNGQFREPRGVARDSKGNLWVADPYNSRVQEFSSTGEYVRQFGTYGTGNGQFYEPTGVAVDSGAHVWVSDLALNRVQEFSSTGEYIRQFGSEGTGGGQFKQAGGIAFDLEGHVWVVDRANSRVQEFSSTGEYIRQFGSEGTGDGQFKMPTGIALDAEGHIWVTDKNNSRVQEFSSTGGYLSQFGSEGTGNGQFKSPVGIAIDSGGHIWVADRVNNRVQEFSAVGSYLVSFGSEGTGNGQFKIGAGPGMWLVSDTSGDIWISDAGNNRVQRFAIPAVSEAPPAPPNVGSNAVSTIEYGVPVSGTGAPYAMGSDEMGKWAQTDVPVEATAVFPPDEPQGWPAGDYKRAAVYYRDANGRTVNVASPGGAIATSEYNEKNDVVRSLSADNRAAALKEAKPEEAAKLLDSQSTYNSEGTELLSTLGPRHAVKLANGEEVQARSHSVYSYDEGAPAEGGPFRLVTKSTQGAQIEGKPEADVRTTTTSYSGQGNLGWKLRTPTSVTTDPSGLKLTHTTVYDPATGNVTETRAPGSKGLEGDPRDIKTIYYTTAANGSYPACGEHPEWANTPCETLPGKQPETSGVPNLPVSTIAYNMYGEPTSTTSTVGASTRTGTMTYDEAGRLLTAETTSSVGTALPKVTNRYDEKTGALVEQSTTLEAKTQSLTSAFNTLGQPTAYTDADGNTTKYVYETEGDARLLEVNDGKGTQSYTYKATTGTLAKLTDVQGTNSLTFTGSYDVEGNLTSVGYPNGMSASYTLNPAGETTGLSYVKTSNCSENCTWFSDSVVPSIHGQWLSQQSTLSSETYSYDEASRLTQVKETPTGEGCTTRIYAYDEETNRTSLTTRSPGTGGVCATEGGSVEANSFDTANRLLGTGVSYEPFGETSKLPAADAGGTELTSSFYVGGRVREQSQNGQTIGYRLDPSGRTRETIDTGTVNSTYISHYIGGGDSPAWTVEPTSGHWKRYVQGLGGLAAIETDTEAPVLQLQDLQGNVVATASTSGTATKLLSTERSSEYGVPTTTKPAKYSWLGGDLRATELNSGVVAMGARSYVPQLGRFLQTDPIPGGSANAYAYTYGDPVNTTDLSGEYTAEVSSWAGEGSRRVGEEERVAREQVIREEAERKAEEAAGEGGEGAGEEAGGVVEGEAIEYQAPRRHHGRDGGTVFFDCARERHGIACEGALGSPKLRCKTRRCWEELKRQRRRRERRRERRRREDERTDERIREEYRCGNLEAAYRSGEGRLSSGLYYSGQARLHYVYCPNYPHDSPDTPCPPGMCDGALEGYRGRDPQDVLRRV